MSATTPSHHAHDAHQAIPPKHEQLRSYLLAELTAGRLKPGEAIPPELQLAERFGVARNTVRQALAALEQEGLISRVRGKGTFIEKDARRRLRRGQDLFALVVPETRAGFYPSLLHGFETAAAEVQHQSMICNTDNSIERQGNVILQLLDKEVGGVTLVPTTRPPTPAYQVRQLQERGIPVVCGHRPVEGAQTPLMAIPFDEVGRRAGQALAERGHRRVAFIATHQAAATEGYEHGLREAIRAAGGDLPEEFVFCGEYTGVDMALFEESVAAALRRMFDRPDPPTGLMASFDSLAEMIYLVLTGMGRRVPEDVSLIGFGGAWRNRALLRRLSSVTIDEAELGRHAVTLLHEMRSGQRPLDDTEVILMPLGLHEGSTLGPAGQ